MPSLKKRKSKGAAKPSKRDSGAPSKKAKTEGPKVKCAFTRMVPTYELKPNPRNPNKHPSDQIRVYIEVLQKQGWRRPIVVSNLSGLITRGHGALLAAKEAGWESVPVDFQDYPSLDLEHADVVADYALAQLAEMDFEDLSKLIQKMSPDVLKFTALHGEDLHSLLSANWSPGKPGDMPTVDRKAASIVMTEDARTLFNKLHSYLKAGGLKVPEDVDLVMFLCRDYIKRHGIKLK